MDVKKGVVGGDGSGWELWEWMGVMGMDGSRWDGSNGNGWKLWEWMGVMGGDGWKGRNERWWGGVVEKVFGCGCEIKFFFLGFYVKIM